MSWNLSWDTLLFGLCEPIFKVGKWIEVFLIKFTDIIAQSHKLFFRKDRTGVRCFHEYTDEENSILKLIFALFVLVIHGNGNIRIL